MVLALAADATSIRIGHPSGRIVWRNFLGFWRRHRVTRNAVWVEILRKPRPWRAGRWVRDITVHGGAIPLGDVTALRLPEYPLYR